MLTLHVAARRLLQPMQVLPGCGISTGIRISTVQHHPLLQGALHRARPSPSHGNARCFSGYAPSTSSTSVTPAQPASETPPPRTRTTLADLRRMHKDREPIAMITAYDYTSALVAAQAEVDIILVGDSSAQVMMGYSSVEPITMDDILLFAKSVTRTLEHAHTVKGLHRPLTVCDLPFGSYLTPADALNAAARAIKEGGADAIKLEGGIHSPVVIEQIRAITKAGIPVMGHVGLLPQTSDAFTVQGKGAEEAMRILEDAQALADAGCFSVVLEMVPGKIADIITRNVTIPTIGIGAGAGTSGQVLVFHDIIGAFDKFVPRFSKQYANVRETMVNAIADYKSEVKSSDFPTKDHTFLVKKAELAHFKHLVAAQSGKSSPSGGNDPVPSSHVNSLHGHAPCEEPVRDGSTLVTPTRRLSTTTTFRKASHQEASEGIRWPYSAAQHAGMGLLRVAVIGGGAMGSLFASLLAKASRSQALGTTLPSSQEEGLPCRSTCSESTTVAGEPEQPSLPHHMDVCLVTSWEDALSSINDGNHGLVYSQQLPLSKNEPAELVPLPAVDPHSCAANSIDLAVLLTKAPKVASACATIHKILRPGGTIACLQNGIGAAGVIQKTLIDLLEASSPSPSSSSPSSSSSSSSNTKTSQNVPLCYTLIEGTTTMAARMHGPGSVVHTGTGVTSLAPPVSIPSSPASVSRAPPSRVDDSRNLASLMHALELAGIPVERTWTAREFAHKQWEKLGVNCVINPLTAICCCLNGALADEANLSLQQFIRGICEEVVSVRAAVLAETAGSASDEKRLPCQRDMLYKQVLSVARATARNESSMLADLKRGVETEASFINGYVAREAVKHGIQVPRTRALAEAIRVIEESQQDGAFSATRAGYKTASPCDARSSTLPNGFADGSHSGFRNPADETVPRTEGAAFKWCDVATQLQDRFSFHIGAAGEAWQTSHASGPSDSSRKGKGKKEGGVPFQANTALGISRCTGANHAFKSTTDSGISHHQNVPHQPLKQMVRNFSTRHESDDEASQVAASPDTLFQAPGGSARMQVLHTREAYKAWYLAMQARHYARSLKEKTSPGDALSPPKLGFVPTMGSLHAGHLGLVRSSLHACPHTVVSIFVNPLQFAAGEDLDVYPRSLEGDVRKLAALLADNAACVPQRAQREGLCEPHSASREVCADEPILTVFAPTAADMYPHGVPQNCTIDVANSRRVGEGKHRPHFFNGVATVVAKLFNIVRPSDVYFGAKDAEQCVVVRSLLQDMGYDDITLHINPTEREPSGLAMSSRNVRIPERLRALAPCLFKALSETKTLCEEGRITRAGEARDHIQGVISASIDAYSGAAGSNRPDARLTYLDICRKADMVPLSGEDAFTPNGDVIILAGMKLGDVKLIDNVTVHLS